MSMKNPLTPAGIEPATFRFVAQHLNHCATAVPCVDIGRGFKIGQNGHEEDSGSTGMGEDKEVKERIKGITRRQVGANVLCSDANYTTSSFYSHSTNHESLTARE